MSDVSMPTGVRFDSIADETNFSVSPDDTHWNVGSIADDTHWS